MLGAATRLGLRVEVDEEVALGTFGGHVDGFAVLVVAGDGGQGVADGEALRGAAEEGEEGEEHGGEGFHTQMKLGRSQEKANVPRVFSYRLSGVLGAICTHAAGSPRHHPAPPPFPLHR